MADIAYSGCLFMVKKSGHSSPPLQSHLPVSESRQQPVQGFLHSFSSPRCDRQNLQPRNSLSPLVDHPEAFSNLHRTESVVQVLLVGQHQQSSPLESVLVQKVLELPSSLRQPVHICRIHHEDHGVGCLLKVLQPEIPDTRLPSHIPDLELERSHDDVLHVETNGWDDVAGFPSSHAHLHRRLAGCVKSQHHDPTLRLTAGGGRREDAAHAVRSFSLETQAGPNRILFWIDNFGL